MLAGLRKRRWELVAFQAIVLVRLAFAPIPLAFAEEAERDETDKVEPVKTVRGRVEKQLTLSPGISRTLEFNFDIGPIYVTDSNLLIYRRINEGGKERKLLFIGQRPGFTDMTIYDQNGVPRITYLLRVTREDIGQVISQLEDLLGDIEGVKIRHLQGRIILDGEILLPRDAIRIFRVIDAVQGTGDGKGQMAIKNLTTLSKITMNILAERIEREIGSPEITVRVVNNNLFLEGTAEGDFEADRAIEIAKTYLPEVYVERTKGQSGEEVRPKAAGGVGGGLPTIVDLLRVRPRQASPPSQDIKITMNYVELKNDYSKQFEFNWRPLVNDNAKIQYDNVLGELTASLVGTVTGLLPKLTSLRDHGHARVLKQQQIIVKDRSEGTAGIESSVDFYVRGTDPKTGAAELNVVSVQNSTKVRAATIPGSDSIDLGIEITLASVVGDGNPPQIARNNIRTQVTIKNGDSAALGGNAFDTALSSYNRPLSKGAPSGNGQAILGLQRSKSFTRDKTQFIIFITPEVIRTASSATEDMTRKFRLNAGDR